MSSARKRKEDDSNGYESDGADQDDVAARAGDLLPALPAFGLLARRVGRAVDNLPEGEAAVGQVRPGVGQLLKQDKLREAIDLAKKYKNSHVAKVVSAGLLEFAYEAHGAAAQGHDTVAAAERAVERASMMTTADLKKGLGGLATIATTAPFIGLLGTVIGIINAFRGMAASGAGGLGSVSAGIAEALVTTALGLFVAIPAVWLYNMFLNKVERFQVEMSNSASELIDYFMKRQATKAA